MQQDIDVMDNHMDPEYELEDPEETILAERKAMTAVTKINPLAKTFRSYMDDFVNPVLYDGLHAQTIERPDNPVEFLSYFLIQNNPMLKTYKQEEEEKKKKADGENNAEGGN